MAAQTAAQKKAAADKAAKAAAKAAAAGGTKKLGAISNGDGTSTGIITTEMLAAHPELLDQGFTAGQEATLSDDMFTVPNTNQSDESTDSRSEEDQASMSAEPTGKFIVRALETGGFRLYNELGQAVSAICTENQDIVSINKAASRSNALVQGRTQEKKPNIPAPTVQ